ncbi:DUF4266 domain-containing protein [Marinibactrum halimedae]|uniref:DUF4266 domain-containing protein n=1 Tax=Marinibactrum halimedae TaxID=1444977 RepID=A0AA37T2I0_9GAMM|nr:DUF4266 domain-containing protein [Marinibactrum halimedae]MCD9459637.1 DUF4266 domain-containing protein [Marinibactrum halimedae]GLS25664.1 hypothetical protein GCM10007877_13780 [Marinibactrum halimedae]
MKIKRSLKITFTLTLFALFTTGCSVKEVKPWQRGNLAKSEMAWDVNQQAAALNDHIYYSKEAASGGKGSGGGGCGCN